MQRFGSIAALRAAAEDPGSDLAHGVRAKLAAASDYLDAAVPVVRVARDARIIASREDDVLPRTPEDPDELLRLAVEYAAESPVTRLVDALANRYPNPTAAATAARTRRVDH